MEDPPELIRDNPEALAMWRWCQENDIPCHIMEVDPKVIEVLAKRPQG